MLKKSRKIRAHNLAAAAAAAAAADSPPPPGLAKSDDLALELPQLTHSINRMTHTLAHVKLFFFALPRFRSSSSSVSRALFVVTSCLPASQPASQPDL